MAFLAVVTFIVGMVGLLRGKFYKIQNRKQALGVLFICLLTLISIGSKENPETKTPNTETKVVDKASAPAPAAPAAPTAPAPAPAPAPVDPAVTAREAAAAAKEASAAKKEAWLTSNFSAWDGSNRDLVKLVKQNLNDPGSFEHEETTFDKSSDEFIRVKMVYRAKNAFGALILQNIIVKINYETKEITVIAQNV